MLKNVILRSEFGQMMGMPTTHEEKPSDRWTSPTLGTT
jgi:hypothetical protein